MTWGWVNDYRIFSFGWTIPFSLTILLIYNEKQYNFNKNKKKQQKQMFLETGSPTPKPTLLSQKLILSNKQNIVLIAMHCLNSGSPTNRLLTELPLYSRTKYFDTEKLPFMVALPKLNPFIINIFLCVCRCNMLQSPLCWSWSITLSL